MRSVAGFEAPPAGRIIVPRYGHGTLADLLPSIGSHLGLGGGDVLGLPPSQRWVVMLVDGLGALQLAEHADHAPYLASLMRGEGEHRPFDGFTAGLPSTTVTSLTSLGTGSVPGQHGIIGYSCRNPRSGQFLNMLTWEGEDEPTALQPHPTYFHRAALAGIEVGIVAPARFNGSGLTSVSLTGGRFYPVHDEADEDQRMHLTYAAATAGERTLVYAYERELDHTGHSQGVASADWRRHLRRIDALVERMRDELPEDVRIVVTGDHGMIDVPTDERLVVEDTPALQRGVQMVAGEGRLRQLYTEPGQAAAVTRRWRAELGERALVVRREQAIAEGWYGPVTDEVLPRYGDVCVAMLGTWAVMTRTLPGELGLVGMHGSLTAAEMIVPLVVD